MQKVTDNIRLVLGTAQLGMDYGIANSDGQPDTEQAIEIVKTAWEKGIQEFDTAQGYGNSEIILGEAFRSLGIVENVKVVTKISFEGSRDFPDVIKRKVSDSLERLGIQKLYGVMIHQEEMLDQWECGLNEAFRRVVENGLSEHVGVSVYSPGRALQAIEKDEISMIQIPANVLDRRFDEAQVFEKACKAGTQVYIRSVYLQGLLLMSSENLLEKMSYACTAIRDVDKLAEETNLNRQQLALGFVKTAYPHAKVVLGAETAEQVRANVHIFKTSLSHEQLKKIQARFGNVDEKIVNPSLWPV